MENNLMDVSSVMEEMRITKTAAYALIKAWNAEFAAAGIPIQKGRIERHLFRYRASIAQKMEEVNQLKRMDFVDAYMTSDGTPVAGTERELTCLFNSSVVSPEKVKRIVESGQVDYDKRVIVVSTEKADTFFCGKRQKEK